MAIIITKSGSKAVKVEKSVFAKEDSLQKYIYENPESIPIYEIEEDVRLLILAREFPTNSGPIDAIGVDQHGNLYIIETKLYKNPDKRTVIAQALDYGASLWKHSTDFEGFLAALDQHTKRAFGVRANEKLKEFFGLSDDEAANVMDKVKSNLHAGIIKFVILMDRMDSSLKDLVLYVNQNSSFDIYAVELECYKHESYEIVIPKIFGAEVKKGVGISTPSRKWTEEMLLKEASEKLSSEEYEAFKQIYEFSRHHNGEIRLGHGLSYGSFSPIFAGLCAKSLFTLRTDGRLSINFGWVAADNERTAEDVKKRLETIGFSFREDWKESYPRFPPSDWLPRVGGFLGLIRDMLEELA